MNTESKKRILNTRVMMLMIMIVMCFGKEIPTYAKEQIHIVKKITMTQNNDIISFSVQKNEISLEQLEFSLWVNYNQTEWIEVQGYTAGQINEYQMDEPGLYQIQVNVRDKDHPETEQKIWLGSAMKEAELVKKVLIKNSKNYVDIN